MVPGFCLRGDCRIAQLPFATLNKIPKRACQTYANIRYSQPIYSYIKSYTRSLYVFVGFYVDVPDRTNTYTLQSRSFLPPLPVPVQPKPPYAYIFKIPRHVVEYRANNKMAFGIQFVWLAPLSCFLYSTTRQKRYHFECSNYRSMYKKREMAQKNTIVSNHPDLFHAKTKVSGWIITVTVRHFSILLCLFGVEKKKQFNKSANKRNKKTYFVILQHHPFQLFDLFYTSFENDEIVCCSPPGMGRRE